MNLTIMRLSAHALLGRRRGLVLIAVPAVLLILSAAIRIMTSEGVGHETVLSLGYTLALPLVALLAATAVLGPEIDDGSIVYLLAKPVSRHSIAASKFSVAWAGAVALGSLPLLFCGLVLDVSEPEKALAWAAGGVVAATAYSALFLALAAFTRHAVVVGLLFVLLWEGLLGNLLSGIRWVSISAWGQQISGSVSSQVGSADIGLTYALVAAGLLTVTSVWFAGDRLRSFTLRGDE